MQYDAFVSDWLDGLSAPVAAPSGLRDWATTQLSYDDAWRTSPRLDWLVWLAAAGARSDDERRDIVAGAALLAQRSGVAHRMFRLAPRPLERAYTWATNSLVNDIDAVVADWFHGILVGLVVLTPLAIAMLMRSPAPGSARSIFLSDLITLPVGFVVTVGGYVLFRRRRLALFRSAPKLDFAGALAISLSALDPEKRDRSSGSAPALDARIFRTRMHSVYARTRADGAELAQKPLPR